MLTLIPHAAEEEGGRPDHKGRGHPRPHKKAPVHPGLLLDGDGPQVHQVGLGILPQPNGISRAIGEKERKGK